VSTEAHASRTRERVRQARQEAYRAAILEAAEQIFADRGYAAAKVQEIAEAAGVATGTVYAIFPGKRELYRAVHRVNLEELARRYGEIPALDSCREILLARVEVATRFLTERPNYLRVYLREAGRWGFDASELPAGATAFVDADLYRRGVAAGELRDEDPELLQSLVMSANQVHFYHWLKAGMREPAEELVTRIRAYHERAIFRA
jgi:TetR/AcrR family transcriptional regulator